MNVLKCDICNKYYDASETNKPEITQLINETSDGNAYDDVADICPECMKKLICGKEVNNNAC